MQFRKTTLFAAVAASLAIGAQGASAQEPQPPTQPPTLPPTQPPAEPQPPTLPTDTLAQPSAAQSSATEIIAAMSSTDAQLAKLQSATVANVRVVNVQNAVQGAGAAQLESAIEVNQASIDKLRTALGSNEAVKSALDQSSVAVENVVAIDVKENGDVVVFYKPE